MRRILDMLYTGAGALAGICIVLITIMILMQIVGRWFGLIIPSTEDFSGYLLAATTFLSLAYTFRHGGHIRVTLFVNLLSRQWQRVLIYFSLIVFTLLVGFGAYYLTYLVYESWSFGELSQGYIAIPLWIPQVPVALGTILFFIALVDDLFLLLKGDQPGFVEHEE